MNMTLDTLTVELIEQDGLSQLLKQHKVTMNDLDRHLKPIEAF